MGSPALGLQNPPPPPGSATAQMGAGPTGNPMGPLAAMIGGGQGGAASPGTPPPGATAGGPANQQGAMLAMQAGINRVIDQMATMGGDPFAPYGDRAKNEIEQGVAAVIQNTPGAQAQQPPPNTPPTGTSPITNAPPNTEAGKTFPG